MVILPNDYITFITFQPAEVSMPSLSQGSLQSSLVTNDDLKHKKLGKVTQKMENPHLSKVNTIKLLDFPSLGLVYRTLSPISRIFLQFTPLTASLGRPFHITINPHFQSQKLSLLPSLSRRYAKVAPQSFQLVIKRHWGQSRFGKNLLSHQVPPSTTPWKPHRLHHILELLSMYSHILAIASLDLQNKIPFQTSATLKPKPKRVTHMTYIIYHIICIYTHHGIFNLIFRQA